MNYSKIINIYAKQKADLGMSESYIAEHTGLSQSTVHRIFTGRHNKAAWDDLVEIGKVLGISIDMDGIHIRDAQRMIYNQAEEIAGAMTKVMQATSQLEGQGLREKAQTKLRQENIHWLLAGPRRKLWLEK